MSIATKLQKILNSKAAIKAAIAGKGGTITDATPLADYAQAVQSIPSGDDSALKGLIDRSITSIDIPTDITTIGKYAFSNTLLTSVTIPSNILTIDNFAFYQCTTLISIIINNGVQTIGTNAFQGTNITSFTFPDTVETLKANALSVSTRITYLDFGTGISTIGGGAFVSLTGTVIVRAALPPTVASNFLSTSFTGKIYVPDASVNAYKTATNWSTWASYIYPLSDYQP